MRARFALLTGTALLVTPSLGFAQGACPPGSWFCEEESAAAPAEDTPPPDGAAPAPPAAPRRPPRRGPRVGVHPPPPGPGEPSGLVVPPRGASGAPEPVAPAPRRYRPRWGLNLRLEGVGTGHDANRGDHGSGMAGFGFSVRYRPVLPVALDLGVDFVGGNDWAGNLRAESALLANVLVYFNPRDAVQVYAIGGLGFSEAAVQVDDGVNPVTNQHYSYFGGQLGLGLEFRLTRRISLNVDVLGFLRGRTDPGARFSPEFTDPDTGRQTNTSGGGLFRGGITFYW
ncbi:MAG: outer membrane beta-barrel protein [Sorangiineae bacterium]|nr:outer membrane beta-barrel protein [Polyangiaceae bacterium]MEB2325007.1 outer membrane beta-barrel protein [Sorangiineae bacterium]